jgi:hypothetical protein
LPTASLKSSWNLWSENLCACFLAMAIISCLSDSGPSQRALQQLEALNSREDVQCPTAARRNASKSSCSLKQCCCCCKSSL